MDIVNLIEKEVYEVGSYKYDWNKRIQSGYI